MDNSEVLRLASLTLWIAFKLALPVVVATAAVGVLVSLVQAVTHVQDQTLPFLFKFSAAVGVLFLTGFWMFATLDELFSAVFGVLMRSVHS